MFDKATTKNALNLLKMTVTCHQKFYVILSNKNLINGSKTTIINVLNKLGYIKKKTLKVKIKILQLQKDARYN